MVQCTEHRIVIETAFIFFNIVITFPVV